MVTNNCLGIHTYHRSIYIYIHFCNKPQQRSTASHCSTSKGALKLLIVLNPCHTLPAKPFVYTTACILSNSLTPSCYLLPPFLFFSASESFSPYSFLNTHTHAPSAHTRTRIHTHTHTHIHKQSHTLLHIIAYPQVHTHVLAHTYTLYHSLFLALSLSHTPMHICIHSCPIRYVWKWRTAMSNKHGGRLCRGKHSGAKKRDLGWPKENACIRKIRFWRFN